MPYGYKVLIQRVPDQDRRYGRWAGPVVIAALALVAVALLVWPARNAPAAAPAPAAHIAAAPTAPARPAPAGPGGRAGDRADRGRLFPARR